MLVFDGVVVFRIFVLDYFENGGWDIGGMCLRMVLGGVVIIEMNWMMYEIEIIELEKVRVEMGVNCISLFDIIEFV